MVRKRKLEHEREVQNLRQFYNGIIDRNTNAYRQYNKTIALGVRKFRQQLEFADQFFKETPENKHLKQELIEIIQKLGEYEKYTEDWNLKINTNW